MHDCLVNGEISDSLHVTDRGLNYGDGLFETIRIQRGQPRFWQSHIDRLEVGCKALGIHRPDQSLLLREVQTVMAGRTEGVVKIILTRGVPEYRAARGYDPQVECMPSRIVTAHALPRGIESDVEGQARERDSSHSPAGLRVRVCTLRLATQPVLAGIKHLNRLEQVMARGEWNDPEISEGILLDNDDYVVCGTASNIFLVAGDLMMTPRLDRCGVRGVMRGEIIKAFKARCEQRRITLDMLQEADEVFLCNSVRGVMPVHRVDDWRYDLGPVAKKVSAWLELQ